MKKIGIIGGGITGYSFAWSLAQQNNCEVTLIEKQSTSGGLATDFHFDNGLQIDKFYHFLYNNDSYNTLTFFKELGLDPKVIWKEVKSAVFYEDELFCIDDVAKLLKSSVLSKKDIFLLLSGMVRVMFYSVKKLDNQNAKEYLLSIFGPNVYRVIWEPLMRSKFDVYTENVPASWIAQRIRVTFFSRSWKGKTKYGYICGTYRALFSKLEEKLKEKKVHFLNKNVKSVQQEGEKVIVTAEDDSQETFDKVILATPVTVTRSIVHHEEIKESLKPFDDLNAAVVIMRLKQKFSDYFWINVNDSSIPFTGIIEKTALTGQQQFEGNHIVYLTEYFSKHRKVDLEDLKNNLEKYLLRINHDFNPEDILEKHVFVAPQAAPVPFINYMEIMPRFRTSQSGIFILNSSMIFPQDRGVGNSIKLSQKHAKDFIHTEVS
jgi:protoporphyrinogen oxidase